MYGKENKDIKEKIINDRQGSWCKEGVVIASYKRAWILPYSAATLQQQIPKNKQAHYNYYKNI